MIIYGSVNLEMDRNVSKAFCQLRCTIVAMIRLSCLSLGLSVSWSLRTCLAGFPSGSWAQWFGVCLNQNMLHSPTASVILIHELQGSIIFPITAI